LRIARETCLPINGRLQGPRRALDVLEGAPIDRPTGGQRDEHKKAQNAAIHERLSAPKVLGYASGGTHEEGESACRNGRRTCTSGCGPRGRQWSGVFGARRTAGGTTAGGVHAR